MKLVKENGSQNTTKMRFSLQHINETPIYLDSIRIAIAFLISCAMQAPITTSVIGIRAQGKSVLI